MMTKTAKRPFKFKTSFNMKVEDNEGSLPMSSG